MIGIEFTTWETWFIGLNVYGVEFGIRIGFAYLKQHNFKQKHKKVESNPNKHPPMILGTKIATRLGPWSWVGESGVLDLVAVPLIGAASVEEDPLFEPRNPVVLFKNIRPLNKTPLGHRLVEVEIRFLDNVLWRSAKPILGIFSTIPVKLSSWFPWS